jgi:hypothetical protein
MTDEHNPYELLETRLQSRKIEYDTIPVPNISASLAVQAGISQATRKHKVRMRWVMSSISVAAFVLLFTGCIRVSPVFASFVKQLPGMEGIVNIISQDKGLMMAIDQSLLQKVGITDEHDGISVTVEGIISDESRMVIFYKIKGMKDAEKGNYTIDLLDGHGTRLPVGYSYSAPNSSLDNYVYEDVIDVFFPNDLSPPDQLSFVVKPKDKKHAGEWKVTTQIDKNLTKGMKKIIDINHTLTLDGQKILIKQATMYPTRLVLDVQFDANNTKKIFGLNDLQLIDEQGRAWKTDTSIGEETRSIHFESMYFSAPKRLTLQGSGLSGLDKKELDFSLDLQSQKITGGPSGLKMTGSKIEDKNLVIDFFIPTSMSNSYTLAFSKVKDNTGKTYEINETRWSQNTETTQDHTVVSSVITNGAALKDTIELRISTYPSKVEAPFSLEIPIH